MCGSDCFHAFLPPVIIIAAFFIFRGILLWYWKVNTIVKNQARTNELLEKLFIQMGGDEEELKASPEESVETPTLAQSLEVLKSEVQPSEVILRSKSTGGYEILTKVQWENDQRDGFDKDFEMVYDPSLK